MRAHQPDALDPWPQDMALKITSDSDALLQLLWIRQVWDLQPGGDDWPPLLPDVGVDDSDQSAPSPSARLALSESWGRIWRAATEHAGNRPSPDLLEEARTASTPERRAQVLTAFQGPAWTVEHGSDGFGEPYTAWREDLLRSLIAEQPLAVDQTPEQQSLPGLIKAWRRGLLVIITIPSPGVYTRTIGRHGLLTTAETRADPTRYDSALRSFDPQ